MNEDNYFYNRITFSPLYMPEMLLKKAVKAHDINPTVPQKCFKSFYFYEDIFSKFLTSGLPYTNSVLNNILYCKTTHCLHFYNTWTLNTKEATQNNM